MSPEFPQPDIPAKEPFDKRDACAEESQIAKRCGNMHSVHDIYYTRREQEYRDELLSSHLYIPIRIIG